MKVIKYPAKEEWSEIVKRPHLDVSQLNATVQGVLDDVKNHGDEAVKRYEEKFDHIRRLHHQRRAERYPSAQRDLPHRKEDGAHLYQVTGTGTKQTSVD